MIRYFNGWTWYQYALFRIFLGLYCFTMFVALLGPATEIYSNQGFLVDGRTTEIYRTFPGILRLVGDSPTAVTVVVGVGAFLSLLLVVGARDRWAAFIIWYILASLDARNPLCRHVGAAYLNFM